MKPLHIGLLVVGAALAGGLAMKMTEPLPVPQAPPAVQASNPAANLPHLVSPPLVPKPSPIPVIAQPERATAQVRAAAPEPIYNEPPKTAIRKTKPILMASVKPVKPTQWTPVPYKGSSPPVQLSTQPAAQPGPSALAPVEQTVAAEPAPAAPAPRQVTLRSGMTIPVRLDESLSSDKSAPGDTFQALLAEPLVVDGLVIAERGARATGRIIDLQKAGRGVSGGSLLELGLTNVATSDGQRVAISTDPWTQPLDTSHPEAIIRFRLASRVTITEQQIAGR